MATLSCIPRSPLRALIRAGLALCAPLVLAACFVSETPVIPAGDGMLPVDGAISLCVDPKEPCMSFDVDGDGYVSRDRGEEGDVARVRFAPLMVVAQRQVFILEAFDESEPGYLYILARRAGPAAPRGNAFDLAAIDCDDLSDAAKADWLTAGGTYKGGWVPECIPPDLATLRTALRASLADKLADEDWWLEKGPN